MFKTSSTVSDDVYYVSRRVYADGAVSYAVLARKPFNDAEFCFEFNNLNDALIAVKKANEGTKNVAL